MDHTFWDQSWQLSKATEVCGCFTSLILFLHHAGNVLLLAVKLCQRPPVSARWTGLNYCGVRVLKIAVCSFDILISVKTQISREENIPSVIPVVLQVGSFTDGTLQEDTPYRRILEWRLIPMRKNCCVACNFVFVSWNRKDNRIRVVTTTLKN